MVRKIVSGGQTGVDRSALDWALDRGIECGGWCPSGRLAEDGTIDSRFPLRETPSESYAFAPKSCVRLQALVQRVLGLLAVSVPAGPRLDVPRRAVFHHDIHLGPR